MKHPKYFHQIAKFYRAHKRLPSYREILDITGLKSTNAVHKIINQLTERGLLKKDKTGKLSLGDKFQGINLLGAVEAGWPSPAEEELADTMDLDEFLIGNREATYMLTVSGDSMIDAGIMPGDLVLVERGKEPKDGDVVIAEVDDGWTLKYFRKKKGKIFLEAANKKYDPIYPKQELKIAAIVTAVVRKYHRV